MLEGEANLTLEQLNLATQAWMTQEYHRTVHSEIGATPLERYLAGPNVGRECPGQRRSCAMPSASRSSASNAAPTAPSVSRASASRSRPGIGASSRSICATPAGT